MTDIIPKGRVITVTSTVLVPETATTDQIDERVTHEGGQQGSISLENPLLSHGWDVEDIEWEDEGTYRETVISDIRPSENGGTQFRRSKRDHHDVRSPAEIETWVSPQAATKKALQDGR